MAITTIQGEVSDDQAGRIDLVVRSLVELSRSKLNGLFEHGCVQLNQQQCADPATRVKTGDKIVVTYDPHQGYAQKKRAWSDRTFSIVHEDDHLLVVNKAAGVLTIPTNKNEPNTLLERISFYLGRRKKNHEAFLIHRLDRGVSGLMVFGKTPMAAKHLREQFDGDQANRSFVAIVNGVMQHDSGKFESWLETHKNLNRFSTAEKEGQHAITKFKVIKRMEDATIVEIQMLTARRHQARVQFFEFGHRILGDARYGNREKPHERWHSKRLAMHATGIAFIHPDSGEEVSFSSDLPALMKKFRRGKSV